MPRRGLAVIHPIVVSPRRRVGELLSLGKQGRDLGLGFRRQALLGQPGDDAVPQAWPLKPCDDIEGTPAVVYELGREAMIESAQWLILRRARQLELHIGGSC